MQGIAIRWAVADPGAFQRANYPKALRSYAMRGVAG
jgi:hypothetical protein